MDAHVPRAITCSLRLRGVNVLTAHGRKVVCMLPAQTLMACGIMRAKKMGTFTVSVQVADPQRLQFVQVEALVDTGASHTMLPRNVLRSLAIEAIDRVSFQLADERVVDYEVGEARIRLDGRERTTLVVFGPEGATPLLGATTLELFNMGVDPVKRRLVPVPGLLK